MLKPQIKHINTTNNAQRERERQKERNLVFEKQTLAALTKQMTTGCPVHEDSHQCICHKLKINKD